MKKTVWLSLSALLVLAAVVSCDDDGTSSTADSRPDGKSKDMGTDTSRLDSRADTERVDQSTADLPVADGSTADLPRSDASQTDLPHSDVLQPDQSTSTPDSTVATLAVSPTAATVEIGAADTTLTATLTGATSPITWSLTGAGSISSTTGTTIRYTPPAKGAAGSAIIQATSGSLVAFSTITINYAPTRAAAVVAYAWANNSTSASYTPNPTYSYNLGGGAITATRSAAGTYAMSFAGLNLSSGDVQVSGYGGAVRCNVNYWSGSSVNILCYNSSGTLADSQYTVRVVLNDVFSTANTVAYAWANDAATASYAPSTAYSYNAGGTAITATRSAAGTYAMQFAGLDLSSGDVQVSAYASAAYCNIYYWSGNTVNVRCYDTTGALVDSLYTVSVVLNNVFSKANIVGYAWTNDMSSASYLPNATYSYNSSGHAITATRTAAGTYHVAFAGLYLGSGHVKVSAYGSDRYCNISHWSGNTVNVLCYDATGTLADSRFTVGVTLANAPSAASVVAYAWANDPSTASYTPDPTYSYNASGGAITATRSAAGDYTMDFAGLDLSSGDVQVSGYGSGGARCNVNYWGGSNVNVLCYNSSGTLVDSQYTVRVVLNDVFSAANIVAYAWANDASTASYTPSTLYSHNAFGAITATRSAAGTYAMQFAGLDLSSGDVQVSAYGSDRHCNVYYWNSNTVRVLCYDAAGTLADSQYTISVVLNNIFSAATILAYAWTDQIASASYTPSAFYSYNSSGQAITATRSAAGTYQIAFGGFSLGSGHVKVSGYGSTRRCNVVSWYDGAVNVACYDGTGALADSSYTILVTR